MQSFRDPVSSTIVLCDFLGYGQCWVPRVPGWREKSWRNSCAMSFVFFFFKFIYLFLRERQRGRERESQAGSTPPVWSPMQGSNSRPSRVHELWDHDLSWSWMPNRLSHPGAPVCNVLIRGLEVTQSTFIFHRGLGHMAKPDSSQLGSQGPRGHFIIMEATYILNFYRRKNGFWWIAVFEDHLKKKKKERTLAARLQPLDWLSTRLMLYLFF